MNIVYVLIDRVSMLCRVIFTELFRNFNKNRALEQWIAKDSPSYGSQSKRAKTPSHWFGKYLWQLPARKRLLFNREIKIHVYGIRQTANVSWEFLRIENKQVKTVQNDSCGQNWHKTTYFCVEAINSKRKIREKPGHVVQIHVCRLA